MQDHTPSKTALATTYIRAAHLLLDEKPLLLNDPIALLLLGPQAAETLQGSRARYQSPEGKALRTHVVLRSRFTEDRLKEAVAKGIQRYVLIGAGYDTFALRQPSWAHVLKIVEVDHPATQAAKLERIAKAGLSEPDNVILASVDFEREELSEALTRCGVGHQEPVFFSWLGVSMYLEEAAIDATLRVIASYAPGSQVSMTFKQPSGGTVSRLADKVSGVGEPFMSFYTPEQIEDKLRRFEFSGVEFLTPEKSKDLYFTPARTDLPLPKRTDTLCATVAG